eukprot:CAMPEP_0174721916 /NCGR_PEP_ID=MMETSP1094-20130205/37517_1 /TAXON_ID=156173 /ORGANISM="Chrysochromulina brevifilum, Strain UTEX LB 985" /LENGTH=375 /DNA_ID=CAMNT_0015922693 /DNA_START=10 /DNA_END=1138 /DNA_ORIENTATION=-
MSCSALQRTRHCAVSYEPDGSCSRRRTALAAWQTRARATSQGWRSHALVTADEHLMLRQGIIACTQPCRMALSEMFAVPPDEARLKLLEDFPGLRLVHGHPPVYIIDHFLSEAECTAAIEAALPRLERSAVGRGRGERTLSAKRTSSSCTFDDRDVRCHGNGWLRTLREHVCRLTQKLDANMEDVQVARYTAGQEYQEHDDCASVRELEYMLRGGQRVATVLVYLNTVDHGGATSFPRLEPPLKVQPRTGRALVFFPGYPDGRIEPRMRHAAKPAEQTKWVAQLWVVRHNRGSNGELTPMVLPSLVSLAMCVAGCNRELINKSIHCNSTPACHLSVTVQIPSARWEAGFRRARDADIAANFGGSTRPPVLGGYMS